MTINAMLRRLVLASPQPQKLAEFYRLAFDYRITQGRDEWRCDGPHRSLWIRTGAANQLLESHFAFPNSDTLGRYLAQLRGCGLTVHEKALGEQTFLGIKDPDERELWFGIAEANENQTAHDEAECHPARLQHYAVRTPHPQTLLNFNATALGFTVSDLVRDESGDLTAAFLRTGSEHHVLAIFRAPEKRFDHFSCETRDWGALRDWADDMGKKAVPLVWGIGRHGPGNDTFFMVHDPDANLVEISSELEVCAEDRPAGLWPHRRETLNQWGMAIMRS